MISLAYLRASWRGAAFFDSGWVGPMTGSFRSYAAVAAVAVIACNSGGGDLADSGGMSGTGISQGSISAFGSIFVNGVEWDLNSATVEIDGNPAMESDLRLGMVVRVEGDFDPAGDSGIANSVRFDDAIEGPIQGAPVTTIPGMVKTLSVIGSVVIVDSTTTIFDGGASFASLAENDVVEVSGFVDEAGAIRATRVEGKGQFPADNDVELRGDVSNLVTNPDGSGIFDLGSIVIRYQSSTIFTDVSRSTLSNGDSVEVEGILRSSGTEVDADEIELEEGGLGDGDSSQVEIEGFVSSCTQSPDFCVEGVPVDVSSAQFDPATFVPMPGDFVEVEGSLVSGTLVADRVESEDPDPNDDEVRIEAAVTSIDSVAGTLVILGVTVLVDGETVIEDESSIDDKTFTFGEIGVGDFLEVRGIETGGAAVRADSIDREDAIAGVDDVRFEGPVTMLDAITPAISVLDQMLPVDAGTQYFDEMGQPRTEEEFFRNPGDVMLDDTVSATDIAASNLSVLSEVDELEIE